VVVDGSQYGQRWSTSFWRYCRTEEYTEDHPSNDNEEDIAISRINIAVLQESHTEYFEDEAKGACNYCTRRFARQFINNPDRLATVFVDSTQMCYVEYSFVDPDDGVSEWRYRFLHSGPPTSIDA
jgi:hypothetical protein